MDARSASEQEELVSTLGGLGAARVNAEAVAKSLQQDLDRGRHVGADSVISLTQAQALVSIAESLKELTEMISRIELPESRS